MLKHKHMPDHCSSTRIVYYTQYVDTSADDGNTEGCTVAYDLGPMCIASLRGSFFF